MVERAPAGEVNTDRNHIMVLSALFLMLLSILLYLIGLYYARMDYPDYIANYPDTSFASLIHPLIIIAVLLMVTSIYLSMNTRRELFLTSGLILLGIYLWNTNSLIVANARVYDSYWHYMISQVIIDQSQFTSQEITSHTFYLNYPLTGIFGAEFSMITNVSKESIVYYFPVMFSVILLSVLYATTRVFFPDSIKSGTFVVLVFIIGNASLQTHFAPQTFGLISFAFLFFLIFKYFEKPDISIKILMIFLIFIIIIIHPLTSFVISLILIVLVFNEYAFKKRNISSSMFMLFFIFFFAWQIYWAIKTSTLFFVHLSNTITLIFTEGLFATAGTEYVTTPYSDPFFIAFRTFIHMLFLMTAMVGFIALWKSKNKKWWQLIGFFLGPFLYFVFVFIAYKSFLYERTIMLIYFPLSISAGYLVYAAESKKSELHKSKYILKFIDRVVEKFLGRLKTYSRLIVSCLAVLILALACISVYAFGLQEQAAIVPTEDVEASRFVSGYDNGSILCYQSNAVIYFYNHSSNIFANQRDGWIYWSEIHKPISEREIDYHPSSKYIMVTRKTKDINIDYDRMKNNLENNTTLNRIYDNGFVQIYT